MMMLCLHSEGLYSAQTFLIHLEGYSLLYLENLAIIKYRVLQNRSSWELTLPVKGQGTGDVNIQRMTRKQETAMQPNHVKDILNSPLRQHHKVTLQHRTYVHP